jgi:hypothetical protein
MKTAVRFLFLVVALAAAASSAAAPRAQLGVTSTLDGMTVLPRHVHWYAHPTGGAVAEVDFLIDGKLRWVQHGAPYIFGDQADGFGTVDRGYLVTTWLTPGMHTFTVRATTKDGRVAKDDVHARVLPAPEVPAALAGKWRRVLDPSGAPKPGSPGAPADTPTPAGAYTLVFDPRWVQTRDPGAFTHASVDKNTGLGYVQDTDYVAGPKTLRVWGAVSWRPWNDYLAEEGTWCVPWGGPQGEYRWSVTGDTLTLAPVAGAEPCRVRAFVWSGTWKRVAAG